MNESSLVMALWAAGTLVSALLITLAVALMVLLKKRARTHRLEREKWKLELEKNAISARLEERDLLMDEFSKEIHDNIGQLAGMVRMHLQVLEKQSPDAAQKKTIYGAMTFVNALLDSVQNISYCMDGSSIHEEGLFNAIGWQVDHIRSTRSIDIRLEAADIDIPLPPQQELVVYRIAQEAINNVLLHAEATEIIIRLHYTDKIFRMEILDDGKGFDLSRSRTGKIGLRNMEHRARLLDGTLTVKSWQGSGTTIILELPLVPHTGKRWR